MSFKYIEADESSQSPLAKLNSIVVMVMLTLSSAPAAAPFIEKVKDGVPL